MDTKAWIVCTLCVIGLALHFTVWNAPVPQPKKPVVEGADGGGGEGEKGSGPGIPEDGVERPDGTETPAVPAGPKVEEVEWVLKTDRAEFTMTNFGGGVKSAKMLDAPDRFVLNRDGKGPVGAFNADAEAGLVNNDPYEVLEKSESHIVFEAVTARGLKVRKTFRLVEGDEGGGEKGGRDFLLRLDLEMSNPGESAHQGRYSIYAGAASPVTTDEVELYQAFFWNDGGSVDYETVSYFGAGMFSKAKPEFISTFESLRWAGVMNQFYASILSVVGDAGEGRMWARRYPQEFVLHGYGEGEAGNGGVPGEAPPTMTKFVVHAGVGLPPVDLAPGGSVSQSFELFMGPKEYRRLAKLGGERREVMFYGWFSVISRALVNGLTWVREWFPNSEWGWGWAVLIVTVMLRLLMWPLHAKSTMMSKKMGLLAPMMKELKEKYKDNPQKMNQETMKLYREYGVNPIGGCLPLLFQIPIFFGFYRMLQYAAELRGQGWLWVEDLSMPDTVMYLAGIPINPLPILMTVTMFWQMKMMPATVDKMQRRIFMLMPILFLWFCYNFASALPLYWTAQNLFGIGQTYLMKKMGGDVKLKKREVVARAPLTPPGQKPKKPKAPVARTGGTAKSAGKKKRTGG